MRFAPFAFLLTGCLATMFGIHHARAREAFVRTTGPCESVTAEGDSDDGWLWHTTGCGKAAWCWYDENERMRCHPSRPLDDLKQIARTAIDCPTGELVERRLDLSRKLAEREWAFRSFRGCDRITWCTEDKIAQPRCAPPEDLHYVLQQLSVESGCPISSIRQLQFFGTEVQNTYRLDACGSQYSCLMPMIPDLDDKGRDSGRDHMAGSRFGSQFACKPVASIVAPVAPAPAVAPAPPPSN
jgi:hypothetical protein